MEGLRTGLYGGMRIRPNAPDRTKLSELSIYSEHTSIVLDTLVQRIQNTCASRNSSKSHYDRAFAAKEGTETYNTLNSIIARTGIKGI